MVGFLLITIMLMGTTFAFQMMNQIALNPDRVSGLSGGRIHDVFQLRGDFDMPGERNKNVFAENFGDTPIGVRVNFQEFLMLSGVPVDNIDSPTESEPEFSLMYDLTWLRGEPWESHSTFLDPDTDLVWRVLVSPSDSHGGAGNTLIITEYVHGINPNYRVQFNAENNYSLFEHSALNQTLNHGWYDENGNWHEPWFETHVGAAFQIHAVNYQFFRYDENHNRLGTIERTEVGAGIEFDWSVSETSNGNTNFLLNNYARALSHPVQNSLGYGELLILSSSEINKFFTVGPGGNVAARRQDVPGNMTWWLRSPGVHHPSHALVRTIAGIGPGNTQPITNHTIGFRPALWINIPDYNIEPILINTLTTSNQMNINYTYTWSILQLDSDLNRLAGTTSAVIGNHGISWTLGQATNEEKIFMPTFNHITHEITPAELAASSLPTNSIFRNTHAYAFSEVSGRGVEGIAYNPNIGTGIFTNIDDIEYYGVQTGYANHDGRQNFWNPNQTRTAHRYFINEHNTIARSATTYTHTARATMTPAHGGIMSMTDWLVERPVGNFWIFDDINPQYGWFYWNGLIPPGQATSLLLSATNLPQHEDLEYIIRVNADFFTLDSIPSDMSSVARKIFSQ